MRALTEDETRDYLAGYTSHDGAVETEHGAMVPECACGEIYCTVNGGRLTPDGGPRFVQSPQVDGTVLIKDMWQDGRTVIRSSAANAAAYLASIERKYGA